MTLFVAADRSIAVEIQPDAVAAMLRICAGAGSLETGGVLIGRYSPYGDRVVVSRITGPPRDSRRLPFGFIRGVAGLTKRFRVAWRDGLYYVGEWHLHPQASSQPSQTDERQVVEFAEQPDYKCPHPVLVVIGGSPTATWSMAIEVVLDTGVLELAATGHVPRWRLPQTSGRRRADIPVPRTHATR